MQVHTCILLHYEVKTKWRISPPHFHRCGKLLKSELDAQAHAARTQHASFSESTEEIKPLTEEEKAEQKEK